MKNAGVFAVALAVALTVGCNKDNRANNTGTGTAVGTAGRADNGVSRADKDFVHDVVAMNAAEIELGRLASQRASGSDVKQFAQMAVTDHSSAGDKLQAFASEHAIEVPTQLDDKDRDLRDKLAAKQGLDFDKDYADAMVDRHQDFVNKLESRIDKNTISRSTAENKEGPDAKVKATAVAPEKSDNPNTQALNQWAADVYPVAAAHLEAAKALRDGVKKRSTN